MDQIKIGKFIALLRKEKNMTQQQLAEKIGVSYKAVSKWETGRGMPDISILPVICATLEISLNELLAGERLNGDNILKKTDENIINIVSRENRLKKEYILIICISAFFIVILSILLFRTFLINHGMLEDKNLAYSQKYVSGASNIKGNVNVEVFEDVSLDFEIGANKYGNAVFKNPKKAYSTFKKMYRKGIKRIKKEFGLLPLSRFNYSEYKNYGWQVTTGTEEEKKEARFVSNFLDIYENSFN